MEKQVLTSDNVIARKSTKNKATNEQILALRRFISQYPSMGADITANTNETQWELLKQHLDPLGNPKSVTQWKKSWRDQEKQMQPRVTNTITNSTSSNAIPLTPLTPTRTNNNDLFALHQEKFLVKDKGHTCTITTTSNLPLLQNTVQMSQPSNSAYCSSDLDKYTALINNSRIMNQTSVMNTLPPLLNVVPPILNENVIEKCQDIQQPTLSQLKRINPTVSFGNVSSQRQHFSHHSSVDPTSSRSEFPVFEQVHAPNPTNPVDDVLSEISNIAPISSIKQEVAIKSEVPFNYDFRFPRQEPKKIKLEQPTAISDEDGDDDVMCVGFTRNDLLESIKKTSVHKSNHFNKENVDICDTVKALPKRNFNKQTLSESTASAVSAMESHNEILLELKEVIAELSNTFKLKMAEDRVFHGEVLTALSNISHELKNRSE